MSEAWDRRARESARWFARFEVYRLLGPRRTVERAFQAVKDLEGLRGERPGHAWYAAAKEWDWIGRAYAWDASERERLRGLEEERRFDAREYRLGMIDWLIAAVFRVLQVANLESMEPEEARAWLPTMRVLFKDLINAQRSEKEPKQVRGDNLVVLLKVKVWLAVWSAALVVMGCGFGPDARGETETTDTE